MSFITNLQNELIEELGVTKSTALVYTRHLTNVSPDDEKITNLKSLDDVDKVKEVMAKYAPSTQRGMVAAYLSILKLHPQKNKGLIETYTGLLTELKETPLVALTRTDDNWMPLHEINEIKYKLLESVPDHRSKMTNRNRNDLLAAFILSLYTDIEPRRNEYANMVVVNGYNTALSKSHNYIDLKGKKMYFFVYKTVKSLGHQIIKYEDNKQFVKVLKMYLTLTPVRVGQQLLRENNEALTDSTRITRIINKALGKSIGSSMLRHIFVSTHLKDTHDSLDSISRKMGHSTSMQKKYIVR